MTGKNVLPLDGLKQTGREDLPVGSLDNTVNASEKEHGKQTLILLNVRGVITAGS